MSIIKPYTFTGGTKARANEVNEDFDRLYAQVNINISDIANINNDIDSLETSKADVNGDPDNIFMVKDPVSDYDAVNKHSVESIVASKGYATLAGNQTYTGTKTFSNAVNFNGTTKVPNSAGVGTAVSTAAISKTATQNQSGYVKLGNGIILQWMKFTQNQDQQYHTWATNFSSGTSYATVLCQSRWGQDHNISVSAQTASSFQAIVEDYERGSYLYAIAIGY